MIFKELCGYRFLWFRICLDGVCVVYHDLRGSEVPDRSNLGKNEKMHKTVPII